MKEWKVFQFIAWQKPRVCHVFHVPDSRLVTRDAVITIDKFDERSNYHYERSQFSASLNFMMSGNWDLYTDQRLFWRIALLNSDPKSLVCYCSLCFQYFLLLNFCTNQTLFWQTTQMSIRWKPKVVHHIFVLFQFFSLQGKVLYRSKTALMYAYP